MIEKIKEIAKEILTKNGHLNPIALFFKGEKEQQDFFCSLDWKTDVEKQQYMYAVGVIAKQQQASQVFIITDAAMKQMSPEAIKTYDETDAPLTYPKSMRTECIIIHFIDLKSGNSETCIVPYKGGDKEPVVFLPELPKDVPYKNWFTEMILKGYNL